MTNPTFGISFERIDNEPHSVIGAEMSVIGIVGTAPLANATVFPLNVPVRIFSDDPASLAAIGATGTIPEALELINLQLGEFQSAAYVVVVRVDDAGAPDTDTMITRLIGTSLAKTGIWALPEAGPLLGVIPRLILVPGFTSQTKTGVGAVNVTAGGSAYATAPTVAITGGGGSGATATAVITAGAVTGVTITNPGSGFTSVPSVAFSGGGGTGAAATAVTELLANPVTAALPAVLAKILGHAVVSGPANSLQGYINWRETMSSDRLIPVETAAKVGVNAVVRDAAAAVVGALVRRDFENGGIPSRSAANQAIYGIVAPNRPINFSLTDGATEGQQILLNNGGIIVRGEAGVEAAIASGGFIYIGTDNAGEDELWRFYNVTRMRDYIHLSFLKTLRAFLGRFNLTGQTIQAIYNTMDNFLRDLQAAGHIIGHKTVLPTAGNSASQLRLGRIQINFYAEEAPVLRRIHIQSLRYLPALDELIANLQSQLDQAL